MNERILDVLLEETVGGVQPPDLAENVLATLKMRRKEGLKQAAREKTASELVGGVQPAPRPILVPAPVAPTLRGGEMPSPLATKSASRNARASLTYWLPLSLAASLFIAVTGYWIVNGSNVADQIIAERATEPDVPLADATSQERRGSATDGSIERDGSLSEDVKGSPQVAGGTEPGTSLQPGGLSAENETTPATIGNVAGESSPAVVNDQGEVAKVEVRSPVNEIDPASAGEALATTSLDDALSLSATTDDQVIAFINSALKSRWKEAGVRASPAATDAEWCRRVYLDCIGRIPTVEELEAFLIDNRRDKRARLVAKLLDDDRYVESYARYWTTLWTNLLIGRTGGMEPNSPVSREGLQQYLRRSLLTNKPYNRFVYELISAEGANRPLEVAYNGAVNFLLAQMQEKATPATAKTAQIFLGLQVQCTQCHNHPFNDWKQNRFWELNAFFRQMRAEPTTVGNQFKAVRLLDGDFDGEGGDPREAEVYFEQRNGIMQVAYPTFIDGTAIDPNGLVSVVDRRQELARLVSRSEELKLTIVNRLWAHFLGYGFTKPLDDMGPHNPPSHPELLSRLANEFAGHGYDLKRLIRWITLSDAYALSSKFGQKLGNAADDPTLGNPALFSHFYLRQMSAEQLYDSLLVATDAHLTQGNYEEQQQAKDRWLEQFAIAFGTDENDEATTFDGTITQTLVLMNGELTRQATSGESGSFLSQVSLKSERAAALNELYLAALARRPSRQEVQVANNLLTAQAGNVTTALEDIWWALLNSNEFILNH
ncbi:MAG TPA: DUF1549 and DUF1553 domain-containing protein [Pirellulales bacterium]|nr:DUF1549 and DUF1553 domain-containing protein [Pirellulales bacterium]